MTVKQLSCLFSFIIILFSCNENNRKKVSNAAISDTIAKSIKFNKLKKLFVVGGFDGNGKQDTIFQHNYSKKTNTEIEKSPDPFENDWEIVENWFYNQKADLYLTINKKNQDTLHLGTAQGLYCLINIGDNNQDGKDEIALVIDKLEMSRVNSCKIYSLCNKKWMQLKQFGVHEDSFDFSTNKAPIFGDIKGYLEKQNNKWVFKDYSRQSYENEEEVGKMKLLKLDKCN
ncbi:hypothetical protein [Flavobacterium piscisymbiosum]|uniref:VCBS repeat-containing protein n=1 Tax=Flavobacterium piscisymbiosum TaxID=2893753 RepID=A0ABS8MJQ1_9FLAO|nr:hypothetical protein [Flavobacterium sp. F-30]MCC9065191.1 hypothetical protein [Flavobacterium sp. F-30]